jgi:hypothetical protein
VVVSVGVGVVVGAVVVGTTGAVALDVVVCFVFAGLLGLVVVVPGDDVLSATAGAAATTGAGLAAGWVLVFGAEWCLRGLAVGFAGWVAVVVVVVAAAGAAAACVEVVACVAAELPQPAKARSAAAAAVTDVFVGRIAGSSSAVNGSR